MKKLKKDVKPRTKQEGVSIVQNEDPFSELVTQIIKPIIYENFVFSEADDKRQCLTMHQPWASLLVLGFKRIEGREWSTDYRGPL